MTFAEVRDDPPAALEPAPEPEPEPATAPEPAKVHRYFVAYALADHYPSGPFRKTVNGVIERAAPIRCLDDVRAFETDLIARHADEWTRPIVTLLNWKELPS